MTIKQEAIKAAHVTDGNADFMTAQSDAVETAMKQKTRAYSLFLELVRVYTAPKLDAMPVQGSEAPATNHPDKFTEVVNGKEVDGTFWNTFADATELGQSFVTILSAIENGNEPYGSMSDPDKLEAKTMARQRRDANRKAVNTAARIHFQRNAVEKFGSTAVKVTFKSIKDKDGDTVYDEDTTTPIIVHATGEGSDPSEYVRLSVGEFLALNMTKAQVNLDAGGVSKFLAVRKSGGKGKKGRGGRTGGDTGKPGDANVKTLDQAIASLQGVAHYMTDEDGDTGKGYAKVMTHLANLKADDRAAFIYTVGSVCMALDPVWTEIETEYNAIVQSKVRAKRAATTDKAATV